MEHFRKIKRKMQVGGEITDLRYPIYNQKTLYVLDDKIRNQCGTDKGCLAAARQGFDLTAASLFGLPKISDIFEQRGITSFKEGDEAKMTEEKKKQLLQTGYLNPYNPKEKGYNSLDSWEFAKYLADTDGIVHFKPSKDKPGLHVRVDDDANYIKNLNLPIGTWIGFGPTDPKQGYFPNSPSVKAGFGAQNHSAQVIGYDEDGQIVLSDYGQARTLKQAMQDNITTIVTPKEYVGKDFNYYKNLRDQEQQGVNFTPTYTISPQLKSEIGYDEGEMTPFLESLSKNKERIIKRLGIKPEQYDNIAKRLIALSGLESEFGTGWTHNAEDTVAPSGNSLGLSQLKWDNIANDEQLSKLAEEFGVIRESDLTDPKKFAVAAMLYGWKHNAYANAAYKKGMEPSHRYYSRNEEDLKNTLRDPNWEKGVIGRDVLRNIVGNETFKMPRRWFGSDEQYAERVNKKLKEDPVLGPAGVRYERLLERKKNENDPDVFNNYIVKPTAGNSPDLTEDQIFFTGWQGYNSLKSGDTQSVNGIPLNFYTKKAENILKGIQSKQRGGLISRLINRNESLKKEEAGIMKKNKSMFQCMKCGGKKMKKGGPTIAEINRGLPMRQLGGFPIPPSYDETEYNQAPAMTAQEIEDRKNRETAKQQQYISQFVNSMDPYGQVQQEYSTDAERLMTKGRFNNRGNYVPNKKGFDFASIVPFMNPAFRFAANMFGPSQDGYASNPLDMQWGQQSIGDTNVAQLGGLIFGPSMEKGGIHIKPENRGKFTAWAKRHGMGVAEAANKVMVNKDKYGSSVVKMANFAKNARKWRGQYGGYNFLGQMTKSY